MKWINTVRLVERLLKIKSYIFVFLTALIIALQISPVYAIENYNTPNVLQPTIYRSINKQLELLSCPVQKLVDEPVIDLASHIGEEDEKDVFGYDATYVINIITAEAGGDGIDQCLAVAQCIYNAQKFLEFEHTPEEICEKYKYCKPAKNPVKDALDAFIQIFIDKEFYEDVGDATVMYNPTICGWSNYHESQIYVTTINDVRYFKETKWK